MYDDELSVGDYAVFAIHDSLYIRRLDGSPLGISLVGDIIDLLGRSRDDGNVRGYDDLPCPLCDDGAGCDCPLECISHGS